MSRIYGPYYRKDGRQHIVIIHDNGRKQTKSYPKYLLEQKIGRELINNETCDHIDENFTNDDPNNLQVLTRAQNAAKAAISRPAEMHHYKCSVCRKPASKPMSEVKHNWKLGKSGPVCSKQCAGMIGKNTIRCVIDSFYDPKTKLVVTESDCWEID